MKSDRRGDVNGDIEREDHGDCYVGDMRGGMRGYLSSDLRSVGGDMRSDMRGMRGDMR